MFIKAQFNQQMNVFQCSSLLNLKDQTPLQNNEPLIKPLFFRKACACASLSIPVWQCIHMKRGGGPQLCVILIRKAEHSFRLLFVV